MKSKLRTENAIQLKSCMRIKVFPVLLLAVLLTICFSGCSGSAAGEWKVTGIEKGDRTYSIEQLAESLGSENDENVCIKLIIKDDGTFTLYEDSSDNSTLAGRYKEKDGVYIFMPDGLDNVNGTIEDGKLILESAETSEDNAASADGKAADAEKKSGSGEDLDSGGKSGSGNNSGSGIRIILEKQ